MTLNLRPIIWLTLLLSAAVTQEGLHAALTPEKLYQKVLPSVMTLEVETQSGERFIGSAVLALADDVAMTAWHVIADARSVWAVFSNGQRVKVMGCIDHDGVRDVALLKLEKRLPHRRKASLCPELQAVAARAYVIGAPKGYDFSISDGLISQTRMVDGLLQYQLSCPISPGNSGSPTFNQRGEVIGIASWTKSDAQNVSFAIPAREFTSLSVSRPPTSWDQLAFNAPVVTPGRRTHSRQTSPASVTYHEAEEEGYTAFQKWLDNSVGKSVTILVSEAGQTNRFSFNVRQRQTFQTLMEPASGAVGAPPFCSLHFPATL